MPITVKSLSRRILRPAGFELRRYDPDAHLDNMLHLLFTNLKVNVVFDVGARIGDFGALLRHNEYRGHIFSFEPVSENFAYLSKRAENDPLWHCLPFALGDAEVETEINVSDGKYLSSFLTASDYGKENMAHIAVKNTETVKIRRLDETFAELTREIRDVRAYLKMDTQGWDRDVFRGARGCLPQIVAMQSELNLIPLYENTPHWMNVLNEFKAEGFDICGVFAGYRDAKWRLSEMDCILVRTL